MKQSKTMPLSIAILDYEAGNLRSVAKALEKLGHHPVITADPHQVETAATLVFPGQGIAGQCMLQLAKTGLHNALKARVAADRPTFGVCLGLQLLFTHTEEGGGDCLGILPGEVVRFPAGAKVPHMGWNNVRQAQPHPLFNGVPDDTQFYFVHSYYPIPADPSVVIGRTDYQGEFASAVARGKLVATQFHPEKSGDLGLKLYANFLEYAL